MIKVICDRCGEVIETNNNDFNEVIGKTMLEIPVDEEKNEQYFNIHLCYRCAYVILENAINKRSVVNNKYFVECELSRDAADRYCKAIEESKK